MKTKKENFILGLELAGYENRAATELINNSPGRLITLIKKLSEGRIPLQCYILHHLIFLPATQKLDPEIRKRSRKKARMSTQRNLRNSKRELEEIDTAVKVISRLDNLTAAQTAAKKKEYLEKNRLFKMGPLQRLVYEQGGVICPKPTPEAKTKRNETFNLNIKKVCRAVNENTNSLSENKILGLLAKILNLIEIYKAKGQKYGRRDLYQIVNKEKTSALNLNNPVTEHLKKSNETITMPYPYLCEK